LNLPQASAKESRTAAQGGGILVDGMNRRIFLLASAGMTLAACSTTSAPQVGADGKPLPKVYKISDARAVSFRFLDSMNTLRAAKGLPQVNFDASLNAAAETHSRDMSVQNRPWHFGSDGSSPLVRVQRSGFTGRFLGENISETYETELETLSSWMAQPDTRVVIMDPMATRLGFAWYQEPGGKIWWTMLTGA
jgi:uncharacterized protein YkwD